MQLAGANREQQNQIKAMADDGMGSKEIAKALRIQESTVKSFMDFDHAAWQKEQNRLIEKQRAIAEEERIVAEAGARVAVSKARKKG